jgi:hypothetical protein
MLAPGALAKLDPNLEIKPSRDNNWAEFRVYRPHAPENPAWLVETSSTYYWSTTAGEAGRALALLVAANHALLGSGPPR